MDRNEAKLILEVYMYELSNQTGSKQCRKKYEAIQEAIKALEQPEIIHCGECKHYKIDHPKANGYHCCYRCHNIFPMKEDDFCSCGRRAERRTDEQTDER